MLILTSTIFTSCNPEAKEPGKPDYELDGLNPESSWAYFTIDLSEYAGKEVTIDLTADVEVENNTAEDYKIWFQVNNSSEYPALNGEGDLFAPGTNKKTITGSTKITINSGALLYLTTHNTTADVKIKITNFKYTVTSDGSAEEEKPSEPAKEYPTDIFTVGEAGTCGIQIGDGKLEPFTLFTDDGQAASNIKQNADGSVEWVATAAGGGGGGTAIYIKSDKKEINIANYESIELEFVYSPITGKWNPKANNPGFALRILPWDSTGVFGGYTDMEYFDTDNKDGYGTCTKKITIPADFADKIISSSSQDAILGFALKFNDYQRGNSDGDQLKVQLKKVKFNRKAGAPEDKPFDDGLTEAQRGKVESINYPTKDYAGADGSLEYEKRAWVYLPAGYDANDKETKYPVFILLHGYGQNVDTWGLSNKGRGGKIKGFMDKGMADGSVKPFILVCATGVASKKWYDKPAPSFEDRENSSEYANAFNYFGEELRNNLLPYIRENYNVADGRDNVALAGLSMGGGQTMNIGIAKCLDLISYFGAFSAAAGANGGQYFTDVDTAFPDLDINYLYMICGDADDLVIGGVREIDEYITTKGWSKLGDSIATQRYHYTEVPGGTHDFPVWYQGFQEYIAYIFK